MEGRNLEYIARACAGELIAGAPETMVARVSTDSRQAQVGDVFFALKGDRFDGHDFLDQVVAKGAVAVVIARDRLSGRRPASAIITVDDPRAALGRLAAVYRHDFTLPVLAVGGSNGKTTTKELVAAVLREKLSTLHSEASFNNDIGVPLTLLRLDATHQAAVLEVGTNHPGELAPLVRMAQPRFGIITTIGSEHLEFFGDVAGVAAEEGALGELLPTDGRLWLNGDNEWTDSLAAHTRATVVRVGLGEKNQWRARNVKLSRHGMNFRVEAPRAEWTGSYHLNLVGRHQVLNALHAIAVGAEFGLTVGEIQRGLLACPPPRLRMQLREAGGVLVLDDSYNANVDSVRAALAVLAELPCKGRRMALLGDMAELGAHSETAHSEIGRLAAESGLVQLFTVGSRAAVTAQAARAAGLGRVLEFGDVEAAAGALKSVLKPGDTVLVKASRAMRLERATAILLGGDVV